MVGINRALFRYPKTETEPKKNTFHELELNIEQFINYLLNNKYLNLYKQKDITTT